MSNLPSNSPGALALDCAARPSADARGLRERLKHLAREQPLFETRPSTRALDQLGSAPPGAIFTGVGIASGRTVSSALPLDAVGLLLSAEQVRRASGAEQLVVLVADAHAVAHGAPRPAALSRGRETARLLARITARCGLHSTRIVRASELNESPGYRAMLREVEARAPRETDPYVLRELADIAHFDARCDGIIKVGWALQPCPRGVLRDERMFDHAFRDWLGREVGVMYGKPGRALDDRHQKMPPYLEPQPERRICLQADEDAHAKLARATQRVSPSTVAGVRRHLRAITRTYGKLVRPLHGSLEQRTQRLIDHLVGTSMPLPGETAGTHVGRLGGLGS